MSLESPKGMLRKVRVFLIWCQSSPPHRYRYTEAEMVERVNDFRQKQLARLEKTLEQYVTASQDAGTISNSRTISTPCI